MTKLLMNIDSVPAFTLDGAPVPAGGIVLDDEMADGAENLQHVKPSDLPDNLDRSLLSRAARKHVMAGRNADAPSGDDSTVKAKKGSQS